MTIQDAQVVHFLPGRIRLKSAQVKGNAAYAQEVQQILAPLPGVLQVEASPTTGSVVILYDPVSHEPLQVLADPLGWRHAGADMAHLEEWLHATAHRGPTGAAGIGSLFGSATAEAASLTAGWTDLRTLVPLTLVLFGLRSVLVTRPLPFPLWYDFFWFAFATYMALNPPSKAPTSDVAAGEAPGA